MTPLTLNPTNPKAHRLTLNLDHLVIATRPAGRATLDLTFTTGNTYPIDPLDYGLDSDHLLDLLTRGDHQPTRHHLEAVTYSALTLIGVADELGVAGPGAETLREAMDHLATTVDDVRRDLDL